MGKGFMARGFINMTPSLFYLSFLCIECIPVVCLQPSTSAYSVICLFESESSL